MRMMMLMIWQVLSRTVAKLSPCLFTLPFMWNGSIEDSVRLSAAGIYVRCKSWISLNFAHPKNGLTELKPLLPLQNRRLRSPFERWRRSPLTRRIVFSNWVEQLFQLPCFPECVSFTAEFKWVLKNVLEIAVCSLWNASQLCTRQHSHSYRSDLDLKFIAFAVCPYMNDMWSVFRHQSPNLHRPTWVPNEFRGSSD